MDDFNFVCYKWYTEITGLSPNRYETLKAFKELCKAIDNINSLGGKL